MSGIYIPLNPQINDFDFFLKPFNKRDSLLN